MTAVSVGLGPRLNNKSPSEIIRILDSLHVNASPTPNQYVIANALTLPSIIRPPVRNGFSHEELKSIWCTPSPRPSRPLELPLNVSFCSSSRFRKYARNQSVSCIWYSSNDQVEHRINAVSNSFPSSVPSKPPPPEPPPNSTYFPHAITTDSPEDITKL
ncbi:hypothetical protein H0H93_016507, partial [Arthromyces matolae]